MRDLAEFSVLLVDDDKTNIEVLNHILSPTHTLYVAKSGAAALAVAKKQKPDLILLDVVMPGMNGFDVMRELKEDPETKSIPVIFITAKDAKEDEELGFSLGAVDYITKPFKKTSVTARVKAHLQIVQQIRIIEKLSLTDALTDIPNRRYFYNHFSLTWLDAAREKKPISLLILDVDNFKDYNDAYGHPQGDVLLQHLAKVLTSSVKRPVDLAARMGGEEFAVILPNTNLQAALQIAETIRSEAEAMRVPIPNAEPASVTVSIGVASTIPKPGSAPESFFSEADNLLYTAKRNGRNNVCAHQA